MSLAALTPCPLCLCQSPVHPALALPPCLSSVPCPLSPEQAGPGTLGPILAASSARLLLEVSALPGIAWPPSPCWTLPPTAQELQAGRGLSYPRVSGPCPPAAEALQTHNALFQEHTAPSSPGAASSTRGFRRASEISIASQVSGMAESYTASSIAQSEFPPCTLPSVLQGAVCAPGNRWQCLDTAGEGVPLVSRDQGCCSTPCNAQDAATVERSGSRCPRGLWREGVVEGSAEGGQCPGVELGGTDSESCESMGLVLAPGAGRGRSAGCSLREKAEAVFLGK